MPDDGGCLGEKGVSGEAHPVFRVALSMRNWMRMQATTPALLQRQVSILNLLCLILHLGFGVSGCLIPDGPLHYPLCQSPSLHRYTTVGHTKSRVYLPACNCRNDIHPSKPDLRRTSFRCSCNDMYSDMTQLRQLKLKPGSLRPPCLHAFCFKFYRVAGTTPAEALYDLIPER
jgi:hypothetical protein